MTTTKTSHHYFLIIPQNKRQKEMAILPDTSSSSSAAVPVPRVVDSAVENNNTMARINKCCWIARHRTDGCNGVSACLHIQLFGRETRRTGKFEINFETIIRGL